MPTLSNFVQKCHQVDSGRIVPYWDAVATRREYSYAHRIFIYIYNVSCRCLLWALKKSHMIWENKKRNKKNWFWKCFLRWLWNELYRTEQLLLRLSRVQPCISPPLMVFTMCLGNAGISIIVFFTQTPNLLFLSQPWIFKPIVKYFQFLTVPCS